MIAHQWRSQEKRPAIAIEWRTGGANASVGTAAQVIVVADHERVTQATKQALELAADGAELTIGVLVPPSGWLHFHPSLSPAALEEQLKREARAAAAALAHERPAEIRVRYLAFMPTAEIGKLLERTDPEVAIVAIRNSRLRRRWLNRLSADVRVR